MWLLLACFFSILALLVWKSDAILTQAVSRQANDPNAAHSLAFLKIPVVWWCFAFFFLSTMTLAIVQTFSVSILQAMHQVSFEAATLTLTAYMLCAAAGMFLGGFVASRWPLHSDKVVATCMTAAAILMAFMRQWLVQWSHSDGDLGLYGTRHWCRRPIARHDDQKSHA
jgi:MFS transporter, FSR family, fosmidomycin resistance protein